MLLWAAVLALLAAPLCAWLVRLATFAVCVPVCASSRAFCRRVSLLHDSRPPIDPIVAVVAFFLLFFAPGYVKTALENGAKPYAPPKPEELKTKEADGE